MREIKFRFWSEGLGMTEPILLSKIERDVNGFNPAQWQKSMQFTGLKDKNGKEIYEGDILDSVEDGDHYFPNRVVVEFHGLAFMFQGITKNPSPFCEYTLDTVTNKNIKEVTDLEIIGNIYETPKLLKEKQA